MGVMPRQIRYFPMAPELDKVTPAVCLCSRTDPDTLTLQHLTMAILVKDEERVDHQLHWYCTRAP